MVYSASITTEKGTAKADAKKTVLKAVKGLIYRIEVEFPPGCCGLLHCKIFDGGYQVFPASIQDSFHSDARVIGFDDLYLKQSAPFEFKVLTWNLDTTWPHTVQVRIGMASTEAFMARYMPGLTWKKFQEALSQAAIEEKARQVEAINLSLKEIEEF
jgi:hypothetical protein